MNESEIRKEFGKFFIDIAKLVFAGVVLATVIKIEGASRIWIVVSGLFGTVIFCAIGFLILKNRK